MTRMANESRIIDEVPATSIDDPIMVAPTFQISSREFLLELPFGLRFHYCKGDGVRVHQPDECPDQEVRLFFEGSVYGAIAYLNGLLPLHASSVVHGGQVCAFTAHSGGGKSTLVGGLLQRGFKLFSDDVLLLDLSDPDQTWCLPGHKKLKLWQDAVDLTGADAGDQVRAELQKFFIDAEKATFTDPLPLGDLFQLRNDALKGTAVSDVSGTKRFAVVRRAIYRPRFANAVIGNLDMFRVISQVCNTVRVREFDRKKLKENYWTDLDCLVAEMGSSDG